MKPYYEDASVTLWHEDCLDVLRSLPDASVDSVVTDPPYGLEFMGKKWDRFDEDSRARAGMSGTGYTDGAERLERPSFLGGLNPKCQSCGKWQRGGNPCTCDAPSFPNERRARSAAFGDWCLDWTAECFRVLKPGGHLLAFGGTRTWHRLACAVEDAGFEVRDSIAWLYSQGFPKSLDVSKAIDKSAGAQREVIRERYTVKRIKPGATVVAEGEWGKQDVDYTATDTAPATDDARTWQGWGTALKPAFEPIVVARKPLSGTVAANVLEHGTGALNIDGCRIATNDALGGGAATKGSASRAEGWDRPWKNDPTAVAAHAERVAANVVKAETLGRWPANVVLDDAMGAVLDEQSGELTSGANPTRRGSDKFREAYGDFKGQEECTPARGADSGGASRFFPTFRYEAKAPASERPKVNGTAHPTVKPLDLMRWLVRLVTPPGGTVLEPFAGSGTTVEACIVEGFRCVAIEREADYLPLITQRINRRRDPIAYMKAAGEDAGLLGLDFGEPA